MDLFREQRNQMFLILLLMCAGIVYLVVSAATASADNNGELTNTVGICRDGVLFAESEDVKYTPQHDADGVHEMRNVECDGDRYDKRWAKITPTGNVPHIEWLSPRVDVKVENQTADSITISVTPMYFPGVDGLSAITKVTVTGGLTSVVKQVTEGSPASARSDLFINDRDGVKTGNDHAIKFTLPISGEEGRFIVTATVQTRTTEDSIPDWYDKDHYKGVTTFTAGGVTDSNVKFVGLALDYESVGNPCLYSSQSVMEDGTSPSGGDINLKLTVDGDGTDNSLVLIHATGAELSVYTHDDKLMCGDTNHHSEQKGDGPFNHFVALDGPFDPVYYVNVSSLADEPRVVNVSASLATDRNDPEVVTLTFTGEATSFSLLPEDTLSLEQKDENGPWMGTVNVAFVDDGGNVVADVSNLTVSLLDSDGERASNVNVHAAKYEPAAPGSKEMVINVTIPDHDDVAGVYTLSAQMRGEDETKQTLELIVSADAENIELSSDNVTLTPTDRGYEINGASRYEPFNITAHVTDADGNSVHNALLTAATPAGSVHVIDNEVTSDVDGMAKFSFIVVSAPEQPVLIIIDVPGHAHVVAVLKYAPVEAAEEAVTLGCLSALHAFASYTCGIDSTASEIFSLIEARGATALHLWNGRAWVRYAESDGRLVPGSSNFSIHEDDVLYVSN